MKGEFLNSLPLNASTDGNGNQLRPAPRDPGERDPGQDLIERRNLHLGRTEISFIPSVRAVKRLYS